MVGVGELRFRCTCRITGLVDSLCVIDGIIVNDYNGFVLHLTLLRPRF